MREGEGVARDQGTETDGEGGADHLKEGAERNVDLAVEVTAGQETDTARGRPAMTVVNWIGEESKL